MQYSDEYTKTIASIERAEQRMYQAYDLNLHPDVIEHEIAFLYYLVHRAAVRLDTLEEIKAIAQRVDSITDRF